MTALTTHGADELTHENARLEAELAETARELRRSRARIASAAAAERERLRRELHDRAQSRLVALQIRLGLARELVEQAAPEVAPLLAEISEQTEAAAGELRRIASGVDPPLLTTRGLAAALAAEVRFCGIPVRVVAGRLGFSARDTELAVYLCCLEAIQNAAKHGGPDVAVTVRLDRSGEVLAFRIEDDGCGFEPARINGSGLDGMRSRMGGLGGRLDISSVPGRGTVVAGAVPWSLRDE
jgi:signal transduction histidine kinase